MSTLTASALFFTLRWSEAANASQNEHRFRSHTKHERESFERMLARQDRLPKLRND